MPLTAVGRATVTLLRCGDAARFAGHANLIRQGLCDPAKDAQALSNEQPQSRLTLGAVQIAKHPVTVAEYALFVEQTGYNTPPAYGDARNPSWMTQQEQPDHPVTSVSWSDARLYAEWLAQLTGEPWRLPTAAEWEKAARGTDGRLYPRGNQ